MKMLALVLLPLASSFGSVAVAHAADQAVHGGDVSPSSRTAVATQPATRAQRQRTDAHCLRSTGSHIPAKSGHCLSLPGRSYSAQDIARTGATTLGDALRMMDPAIH